jgi:hypothetical protein
MVVRVNTRGLHTRDHVERACRARRSAAPPRPAIRRQEPGLETQDKAILHVVDADGKECKSEVLRQERLK